MNSRRSLSSLLAIGFAMLVLAGPTSAQQERPRKGKDKDVPYAPPPPTLTAPPVALMIAGFDRNGDRRIDRAEYDAGVAQSFAAAAGGKDALSLIDLGNWARDNLGDAGARPGQFDFDANGDDRIDRAEFLARFDQIFTSRDKDRDGALSRAELLDYGSPCRVGPGSGLRPGQPPVPGGAPGGTPPKN